MGRFDGQTAIVHITHFLFVVWCCHGQNFKKQQQRKGKQQQRGNIKGTNSIKELKKNKTTKLQQEDAMSPSVGLWASRNHAGKLWSWLRVFRGELPHPKELLSAVLNLFSLESRGKVTFRCPVFSHYLRGMLHCHMLVNRHYLYLPSPFTSAHPSLRQCYSVILNNSSYH